VLRSDSKKLAQTTSVRYAAESVFKITNARFIRLCHTITSDDKADFAFLKFAAFALDLAMETRLEDRVRRQESRA
jgi:hypothetical protein